MDDNKVLQQLVADVKQLTMDVQDLKHSLNYVTINNGGGIPIKFRREDFYQRLYQKPNKKDLELLESQTTERIAKMIKNAPINSLRVIARDLTLIGGMVTILLKLFGVLP